MKMNGPLSPFPFPFCLFVLSKTVAVEQAAMSTARAQLEHLGLYK